MSKTRSKINESDRRHIIGKSGGRCNKCRRELFITNELGEAARLGDDAHIVGHSTNGPRGLTEASMFDRQSIENLILLCKTCHGEVDQQPQKYTTPALQKMRNEHYSWVEACLGDRIERRPRFHYLSYINIPRVEVYAVVNSIAFPTVSFGKATSIRGMGLDAGRLMAAYTSVLNHEELFANELSEATELGNLEVGSYWFSPPANFRTRKVHGQSDVASAWAKFESVIYRKLENWKLFCLIDPKWITTATAYSILCSGTLEAIALVTIIAVDLNSKTAIASPLFLGAPDPSYE